jgi:hypothetical protein
MQFATTPAFLEYFGLASLDELPDASELRRIPVQRPDSLLTVDPGLATAPPDAVPSVPADALALPLGDSAPAEGSVPSSAPSPEPLVAGT